MLLGLELGVGEGIIIKAIAQTTGRAPDKVKSEVVAKGDVGLVAEASKGTQRTLSMFRLLSNLSYFSLKNCFCLYPYFSLLQTSNFNSEKCIRQVNRSSCYDWKQLSNEKSR